MWATPSFMEPRPLWDDGMLAMFGLTESDVQARMEECQLRMSSSTSEDVDAKSGHSKPDATSAKPSSEEDRLARAGVGLQTLLQHASQNPLSAQHMQVT
jgi:hypothetical protein